MGGNNYKSNDGCCWLSFDPCAFASKFFTGLERGRENQAEQEWSRKAGWSGLGWDGWKAPGCIICRMLSVSVDPQISATLGNKVAHCLLYQLSQHQDICHRIWSPAVLCYWKHSTNMIQQTTTWLVWSTQNRGNWDLHHFVTTCLVYSGCQDRVLSWADQTSRVEDTPKRWNSSSPTLEQLLVLLMNNNVW